MILLTQLEPYVSSKKQVLIVFATLSSDEYACYFTVTGLSGVDCENRQSYSWKLKTVWR